MTLILSLSLSSCIKVRHRVVRVADVCPVELRNGGIQCDLTCKLCRCCAHLFKCNCGGATKIGKMCKHIHAVVQCIQDSEPQQEEIIQQTDNAEGTSVIQQVYKYIYFLL